MTKTQKKRPALRTLILSAILSIALALPIMARANEEEASLKIPETPAAIWKIIDQEMTEMTELVEAGTLDELHHHALAVSNLVVSLPEHSVSLPAADLAQIKANGKFVAILAERLDEAGDSGDKAGAETNFEKLKTILVSIRKNYPD